MVARLNLYIFEAFIIASAIRPAQELLQLLRYAGLLHDYGIY